jgi:beta-lactamase superfamily II metal-dependent hydrolase
MRRATWIAAFLLLVAIAIVLFSSCRARRDAGRARAPTQPTPTQPAPQPPPPNVAPEPGDLVIRVLDVGQGDATLVTNGRSTALIDGGPDGKQLGVQLDRLGLGRDTTIDLVILSHAHSDHYMGLRELFSSRIATSRPTRRCSSSATR